MLQKLLVLSLLAIICAGCSGTRIADHSFYAHAESIRVLGMSIPEDDQKKVMTLVPSNVSINTMNSTPADWTSVLGVLGNILWIHSSEVVGTTNGK